MYYSIVDNQYVTCCHVLQLIVCLIAITIMPAGLSFVLSLHGVQCSVVCKWGRKNIDEAVALLHVVRFSEKACSSLSVSE